MVGLGAVMPATMQMQVRAMSLSSLFDFVCGAQKILYADKVISASYYVLL